jgi:CHAT domain-containing protein/tetratricopeptide (TPR) repeat protein
MAHENQDQGLMRRYLLGQLAEDERQKFEETMMADNELYNRVLLAEDEMVEEYLQGELSESERAGFEASFLSTPEGQQQVSFAKALTEYVWRASASGGRSAVSAPEEPARVEPAGVQPARVSEESARVTDEPARPSKVSRPVWWSRPALVPYLRMAAAAVIVLGLGLGIWRAYVYFQHSQVSKGIASLREAYRDQRPTEARITDLNYAPPPPTTRGSEPEKFDYVALDRAKALIQVEANEHPSAQSHHDLGRLYLAEHEYDKAIDQFEKALELDEKNAQLHNDLGAALLEKAKAERTNGDTKSPETFAQSLTHLNQSVELDASLPEALFNRALCRQEINLFEQAENDWRAYLEKDQHSKWADEARIKLKELEERRQKSTKNEETLLDNFLAAHEVQDDAKAWVAFSQSRFRTGNIVTGKLIDAYLISSARGLSDQAQSEIAKVVYAGDLETKRVSDRFTADLAQFYKSASPSALRDMGRARRLMASAAERSKEAEYEQAIKFYSKAKSLFERAGNSCESAFSELWIGISGLRIAPKESLRILEPLAPVFERKGYRYLLAMCLNGIADAQLSHRELSRSLDWGNRAFETSEQIRDFNGMLRNLQFPVAVQQQVGDYNKSLVSIFRAFDLASRFSPDPKEIWAYYQQSALNYYSLGQFETALEFQAEALRVAIETGLPLYKSRSYAQAGLIHEKLKDYDEAIKNVELALSEGQRLAGNKGGLNLLANSTLSLAHLYEERGDLGRALVYYDRAIELHKSLDIEIYVFQAHKGKLLSLIGLGDDAAAEQELKTTISLIEEYRPRISEETSRNAFFDLAQSVYDLAIGFSHSQVDGKRVAFDYAEASHGRSLLDLMKSPSPSNAVYTRDKRNIRLPGSPLTLTEIEGLLPSQAQIIVYSVLDDRLLIGVISRGGFDSRERKIAAGDLSERVRGFVDAVKDPGSAYAEVITRGTQLYEQLISPIEDLLNPDGYLCIVPDKVLNYLPFCSLVSSSTGRYFTEERVFTLAPSSTVFLACSDEARRKEKQIGERFLIVANPTLDLAAAEREAREASEFYRLPVPLVGPQAIKSRVKSEMRQAHVIEFASHYVPDSLSPMRSKLLLAKGAGSGGREGDSGDLEASEIYDMKLPRAHLVVLSACQTGVEQSYRGEGAISMARAFIKAGAPTVVASLWPVDSSSTADLMISFHRYRTQGIASTAEALRRAQRDMLVSSNERNRHPYYWAAFSAIGGYATF